MPDRLTVYIFHDRPELAPLEKYLRNQGFNSRLVQDPLVCLQLAETGMGNVDAVLVHKDLGQHYEPVRRNISSNIVVARLHEVSPFVRIGIVSGEYPDGEKHVLNMGADFYCNALDLSQPWTLEQLSKGWVTPEEIKLRGTQVSKPPEENLLDWYLGKER